MGKRSNRRQESSQTVTSFCELHEVLSRFGEDWIFRGHAREGWKLVPKAGRTPYLGHERKLFDSWKRSAAEHQVSSFDSDWDWLAIAQHHRLATRLRDWTTNPLNAAYFAVRDDAAGPAIIHAARFEVARTKPHETLLQQEPLAVAGVYMFRPRYVVPRIVRQGGLFTVHGPPELAIDDEINRNIVTVERIVIDVSYRRQLMAELARY